MEIISFLLEFLILLEFIFIFIFAIKVNKNKPTKETFEQTSKMVNKILLTDESKNIDNLIGILRKDSEKPTSLGVG